MGVSTNFYTIYGIKVPWSDEFNEVYDEVYDDDDTPFVLMDGMSGKYMIFGIVLFDSGDMRWGFEDGDFYKEYNVNYLTEFTVDYILAFRKKFPNFSHLVADQFKIISLVHYS